MSLLSNPWLQIGMGLLANSGPSLAPVNPWRGVGQGLMAASEAKAYEAQQAYEQQRMAVEQQKYEQEQQRQQMLQQWAQTQPDPQGAALFPEKAYELANTASGEAVEIRTAGELGLQGFEPNTPIEVTMKGGRPTNYTPMTPPAAAAKPASYQEWELAGKPGDFASWVMQRKAAGATKVEMGAGDMASPSDVANMVYPDGTQPLPGTAWPEIVAKGGRTLTNEEKAAQTARGTQTAKNEEASGKGGDLLGNYVKAAERYQSGILPYGPANSQAIIARNNLVTFYAKNVLGTPGAEPSPALYERAAEIIPDFGGPIDAALFESRMAEIKRGIDSALGKEGGKGKKDQGMGDVEMVYDPKLKRLVPAK